ncbi:hypothetical protein SCA6_018486 [Theobroma cacao]
MQSTMHYHIWFTFFEAGVLIYMLQDHFPFFEEKKLLNAILLPRVHSSHDSSSNCRTIKSVTSKPLLLWNLSLKTKRRKASKLKRLEPNFRRILPFNSDSWQPVCHILILLDFVYGSVVKAITTLNIG